jgi:hypothetical protein
VYSRYFEVTLFLTVHPAHLFQILTNPSHVSGPTNVFTMQFLIFNFFRVEGREAGGRTNVWWVGACLIVHFGNNSQEFVCNSKIIDDIIKSSCMYFD